MGCTAKVRAALAKVDGVKSVDIDFAAKTATVELGSADVKPEQLIEAIVKAGYGGKVQ